MLIAVTGGSGALGRELVAALAARGHDVRSVSRSAPPRLPAGAEHVRADLLDGSGLGAALDGADAVIDAVNAGPRTKPARALLIDGTRRLLAAEARAGIEHHVAISIVGVDRAPSGYYGVKLEQEGAVRDGGVPWTIVRATQFHAWVDGHLAAAARLGVLPGGEMPMQPVDVREVAQVLADTVEAEPSAAVTQFAGPEILPLGALARLWRDARGRRAAVVPAPVGLLGAAGRAMAEGALTNPGAWRGRIGFAAWLRDGGAGAAGAQAPCSCSHSSSSPICQSAEPSRFVRAAFGSASIASTTSGRKSPRSRAASERSASPTSSTTGASRWVSAGTGK
jgi:uncharacterized protein YbjT (DUF2867 family)